MKQPKIRLHDGDSQRLPELAADFHSLIKEVQAANGITWDQSAEVVRLAVLYDIRNEISCIRGALETGQN